MKTNLLKKLAAMVAAGILTCTAITAMADTTATYELDGNVINTMETPITADYSGVVGTLTVREGDHVNKGDTIATLKTTSVYAAVDGTVCLFGDVGDSAAMVTEHYGAVAYVEPDIAMTISASTRNAYDAEANKVIHPGEKVYLRGNSTLTHVGTGTVTQVSGTSFTVDIEEGNFESGESINVYRDSAYTNTERIGRGNASRTSYAAYEGSGIIVKYVAANGSHVKKGDVLFETIEGEFAGYGTDLTEIKASESGVISTLSIALGSSVNAGDTVCTIYPDADLRVEASVNEENLSVMEVGTTVHIHFNYVNNGEYTVDGIVEKVSATGADDESDESDEAFFKTIIRLENTNNVKYGMSVTVTN